MFSSVLDLLSLYMCPNCMLLILLFTDFKLHTVGWVCLTLAKKEDSSVPVLWPLQDFGVVDIKYGKTLLISKLCVFLSHLLVSDNQRNNKWWLNLLRKKASQT